MDDDEHELQNWKDMGCGWVGGVLRWKFWHIVYLPNEQ